MTSFGFTTTMHARFGEERCKPYPNLCMWTSGCNTMSNAAFWVIAGRNALGYGPLTTR